MTPTVHAVRAAGTWAATLEIDHIALDHDRRHRRRLLLTTAGGAELLLDLPHTRRLHEGDGLQLAHGIVRVTAAPEPVMDIHAPSDTLMRIAWHLGNRHLPVQLHATHLRIRADHVIATMIAGLGGHVHARNAPFEPEGGAYAPSSHAHNHAGDHDHAHE